MAGSDYMKAYKLGEKASREAEAKGESPYLPALDEVLKGFSIRSEVPLGMVEIPLDQIVGTKTAGRKISFAGNFMPIMDPDSEFANKWSHVYDYQMETGVSDPIEAYEFMNRYYVLEGNKRVSVLKFLKAFSIEGTVTRIVPQYTEDPQVRLFYESMEFYRKTQINYVTFTKPGSYLKLIRACGQKDDEIWSDEAREIFSSNFLRFRKIFNKKNGDKYGITAGDAFLMYLSVYPYDKIASLPESKFEEQISGIWDEMVAMKEQPVEALIMEPKEEESAGMFTRFMNAIRSKQINIAFVHEKPVNESGWTYSHELGRMHIDEVFGSEVKTAAYFTQEKKDDVAEEKDAGEFPNSRKVEGNELSKAAEKIGAEGGADPEDVVPEAAPAVPAGTVISRAEQVIETAVADGNHIIFTTSERLLDASLKVAVRHPEVKILNCCVNRPYKNIRTYYGRMYEAKYLEGMAAGAMTANDKIAYQADYPIYGSLANINAFALGALATNPRAKIYLSWIGQKGSDLYRMIEENDIRVVADTDTIRPGSPYRRYGLYLLGNGITANIAAPIWNWGRFYEKIVRDIVSGSWNNAARATRTGVLNYWWGISGGIIDLITSQNMPDELGKLVALVRNQIYNDSFHPFRGLIRKQDGTRAGTADGVLSPEEIITMNYLCYNVIGSIPALSDLTDEAKQIAALQGIYPEEEKQKG